MVKVRYILVSGPNPDDFALAENPAFNLRFRDTLVMLSVQVGLDIGFDLQLWVNSFRGSLLGRLGNARRARTATTRDSIAVLAFASEILLAHLGIRDVGDAQGRKVQEMRLELGEGAEAGTVRVSVDVEISTPITVL